MYKYEMHLHSSACSACAFSDARKYIDEAIETGYAGMVFTNHFYHGNTAVSRLLPWEDFVGAFRDDYLRAKEYGESKGIDVLFGIEEVYEEGSGKEILIYGLSPEDLLGCPDFLHFNVYEMSDFVRNNGGYVVCAHPFRRRDYIPDPDLVPDPSFMDAVEIYNFANSEEDDQKAVQFADIHQLPGISGGDVHTACNFGQAGLAFYERISDNSHLVQALKEGRYRMIRNGEIV
ncbi:MAG: PHP-associated domain-containing protein [Lachnospiraceae bacterium]|nr:PHP-associated domain-containing protein [Lachnospiraceae bacterium]